MMISNQRPLIIRSKVIVLGDTNVGKSSLIQMFVSDGNQFPSSHIMTCHPELFTKTITIPDTNASVELYLLDLPGNDVFQSLIQRHYQGSSAFIIVYDVTNSDSLNHISTWLKLASTIRQSSPLIGVLVATKCDLSDNQRVITTQQGQDIAQSLKLEYFECSSLTNMEVTSPFHYIANTIYESYDEHINELVN